MDGITPANINKKLAPQANYFLPSIQPLQFIRNRQLLKIFAIFIEMVGVLT
jgi:hypothetical protein